LVRLVQPASGPVLCPGIGSRAVVIKAVHRIDAGEMPRQKAGTVAAGSSVPRSGE
jgi:hypothetical protein